MRFASRTTKARSAEPSRSCTGDSFYLRLDLPNVFHAFDVSAQPALMTVLRNEGRWDRSNADFDGKLVTRYSKSQGGFEWIDYGLIVLERDVVAEIPADQPSDLADLMSRLSGEGTPRRLRGEGTLLRDRLAVRPRGARGLPDAILALADDARISGFTTNPTLMWKAGLTDYRSFAERLLERITKHPISFEVFADSAEEVRRQARLIASWGENVYVKVPVTLTTGETMAPVARELSESGVKVNVTAVFTTAQVELVTAAVKDGAPSYVSVFAGRIADAGIDPQPIMARASTSCSMRPVLS